MSHQTHAEKLQAREASTIETTQTAAGVPCAHPAACDIRRRAYEISISRNGGPGDETSDWTQAEQELASLLELKN